MQTNVAREVPALKRMTPKELRGRYLEVFGEESRSGNKDFLWKRIAWRIQALAEGDLSERARRRAEELANDADIPLLLSALPIANQHEPGRRVPLCARCLKPRVPR